MVTSLPAWNFTSVLEVSLSGMSGRSRRGGSITPSQSARPAFSSSTNDFVRTQRFR